MLKGSTHTRPNHYSSAAGADAREGLAWVADGGTTLGGLRLLDLRDPAFPFVVGATSDQFGLTAVKVEGRFAIPEGSTLKGVEVRVLAIPGGQVKLSRTITPQ